MSSGKCEPAEETEQPAEEREGDGDEHGERNIEAPGNQAECEAGRELELLHQHRLDHVEHRHRVNLQHGVAVDQDSGLC